MLISCARLVAIALAELKYFSLCLHGQPGNVGDSFGGASWIGLESLIQARSRSARAVPALPRAIQCRPLIFLSLLTVGNLMGVC